jgi:tetratricopeptide (TPR) repeat protein
MNIIFPLIYSTTIFLLLFILTFYIIGQIQLTKKVEEKMENLKKKIQLINNTYEDNYKLGQIFLRKNLYQKAIFFFQESLKFWNSDDKIGLGSLYNTLAYTYFKLQNYYLAIYYYKCAINLLPDYFLALKNLAFTYEKLQNYEKALIFYLLSKLNKNNKKIDSKMNHLNRKRILIL